MLHLYINLEQLGNDTKVAKFLVLSKVVKVRLIKCKMSYLMLCLMSLFGVICKYNFQFLGFLQNRPIFLTTNSADKIFSFKSRLELKYPL